MAGSCERSNRLRSETTAVSGAAVFVAAVSATALSAEAAVVCGDAMAAAGWADAASV
jgi:hypothetical protein